MLTHIIIRNFAIIDHLEIPFRGGLTVLSGETGAGKSIIIDALNLVLGGRASVDVIRNDADKAVVEANFDLAPHHRERIGGELDELGIDTDEGNLVIRRIVSRSGKNKVLINGSLTTVAVLQRITAGLVDISGQHEHYSLMRKETHLELLDEYGVLQELLSTMAEDFQSYKAIHDELESIRSDVRDRLNRIDFLRYQLSEIESANLRPGEEEELGAELGLLQNAERISDSTHRATFLLYEGENSACERVAAAANVLQKVADFDPRLAELASRVDEARLTLEDAAREIGGFVDDLSLDGRRLDSVIERLDMIKHLRRKHGADIETILAEGRAMREELDRLENAEERGEELVAALEKAEAKARQTALQLRQERKEAALLFTRSVEKELEALNMTSARVVMRFAETDRLTKTGVDQVELLLAANQGEDPKSIQKIASGGELSRVMLAIKTVLAERDTISTYVFDEVDAGIGGSTADQVGAKIAATGKNHQVFCITHLPQIASRGDHHYLVEKTEISGRTESRIRPLTNDERVDEVARMLGGARVTQKTKDAAAELLKRP